MNLAEIQSELRAQRLDGWLFFDHHQRDPIAYRVLGFAPKQHVTRRWYYLLPAEGAPVKLVHRIESGMLDALPGERRVYSGWRELRGALGEILKGKKRLAMQYSPDCMIPYVSLVDAGTVEMVRGLGADVVSSAGLVQRFEACWTAEQLEMHLEAGRRVDAVRREAFEEIGRRVRAEGSVQEVAIAEFVRRRFWEQGVVAEDGPIVGVNANSGNPHYEPSAGVTSPIRRGDFVLLDMWAKLDRPGSVYYDITWTASVGAPPSPAIQRIFEIVRGARDHAVEFIQSAVRARRPICGFEVDDATRNYIAGRGHADHFVHRTGHSIGEEIHGNGANMDNLETHDDRPLVPGTCFSIEPGIYLPEFGVRSELNVYVGENDARVTGEIQRDIVIIAA
ncbi:MAG TPA: Xaa-Pro peptidase family protein [Bryobacterales bacterium]|nr:Xaa-Pro peptidase family protein [Bryobacterales bacterium]